MAVGAPAFAAVELAEGPWWGITMHAAPGLGDGHGAGAGCSSNVDLGGCE
jgi:hypothetical protein